jgi:hypothetical protein
MSIKIEKRETWVDGVREDLVVALYDDKEVGDGCILITEQELQELKQKLNEIK